MLRLVSVLHHVPKLVERQTYFEIFFGFWFTQALFNFLLLVNFLELFYFDQVPLKAGLFTCLMLFLLLFQQH